MKRKRVTAALSLALAAVAAVATAADSTPPPRMKPALIVMDVQNAYLPMMDERDTRAGLEMINYVIPLFRENGFPVIRVYHTDPAEGPEVGSPAFAFPESVAVTGDDPMIVKNFPDAFKKTGLDALLKKQGVNTVFLAGLSGVGCVLATYHGAADLDYNVFMVKGALISHDAALTKSVYEICSNVSYYPLKLLLETARTR